MKKFFLIPLMTMLCTVMAWGATRTAGTFAQLQDEIAAAAAGDVIELTADITYPANWATNTANDASNTTNFVDALNINKSLTLDGKGHSIKGFGRHNVSVSGTAYHRTTLAIHPVNASDEIEVTIKNLNLGNTAQNKRYYGIISFDGVKELTLENVNVTCNNYSAQQAVCFTGANTTALDLTIKDSYIYSGKGAYPAYILKPVNATLKNSTFEGYCALYFKYRATAWLYGNTAGTRGSVVNAENCNFNAPNVHDGYSNDFAVFACEDDNITLNLHNCGMNAEQLGSAGQDMVSASEHATRREQNININISGDNSYINGNFVCNNWNFKYGDDGTAYEDAEVFVNGYWQKWNSTKKEYDKTGYDAELAFTPYTGRVNITITGGTYAINPYLYRFNGHLTSAEDLSEYEQRNCTIPDGYEVKEITTQQGGLQTTLYRVRKTITTSESINDNVEGQGDGVNANTEFLISANETVAADATVAHYVEVSNDATLTLPAGKELTVKNGLDVTDGAVLDVKAGSTLIVGEGGVTAETVESIVVEADENGSASFLLDPEVIVNTTPNITIKMTAKGVGYEMDETEQEFYWFRFAAPVAGIQAVEKAPERPTYFYKWDYAADQWSSISALGELEPFQGFSLTTNHEGLEDVTYTFKGRLAGNQDMKLQFQSRGYNYFGNSYTGYIDVLALVQQLMENDAIDGTVYMWNNSSQGFIGVPIGDLTMADDSWKREVAPMQTFILRQVNTGEPTSTTVNYASAIWGNPRYGLVPAPAPARQRVNNDVAKLTIVVTSANGKIDEITFKESNEFSDEYNKGFDAVKFMNERQINLYTTINDENLGTVATDNIEGKLISMQTVKALNYTMSFEDVNSDEYAIRDNVTGKVIAIEEGATYEFAAQPNSVIEGRFEIVSRANMPTAIENTEVKANVKGIYTIMGQYLGENFDILPAGVYVVDGVKIVK